jgi:DNA-binding NtrC family response regulator
LTEIHSRATPKPDFPLHTKSLTGAISMTPVPAAFSASASIAVSGAQLTPSRTRTRTVLVASSDASLRERLRHSLTGLRWQVLEAPGGAEAWVASQAMTQLEALLIDPWLPDLEVSEFLRDFHREHPHVDLMMTDGAQAVDSGRSPYHQELLYALRRSQEGDTAAWQAAPPEIESSADPTQLPPMPRQSMAGGPAQRGKLTLAPPPSAPHFAVHDARPGSLREGEAEAGRDLPAAGSSGPSRREALPVERIPELIGSSPSMIEVSRRIRLVAARSTPVLIEGPTGSGKELVAEALHRLSIRSRKPFVAINCAAIPEALLEAELFGHTRGAFTGAVQGRTGRIESADGGTLFLDEIGEMPLGLQSKLLRFFESGELQRIGDNETVKVDVRIVAATHQPLAEDAQKGLFRADLYYRLAVFLIRTPALLEHMEDLPHLVAHFLERMGRKSPVKRIDSAAMARLSGHPWPGNVRELEHVLERAAILAGDEPVITSSEIDFGLSPMN